MSEFLRYVLWELRRYSFLAVFAVLFTLMILGIVRFFYKRKYGADRPFPWKRAILIIAFAGYIALVFFVTNFRTSGMIREVNLHLFRAWREALNNFSQHRWLNVLLNIAMFCPFGFLLPLLSRKLRKWYFSIPAGFAFSLMIELLQLIFSRGVFDVDDLFCNTLGAMIGYFVVMVILSGCQKTGERWRPMLTYGCLTLISMGSIGGVFVNYHVKEFGNLPQQAAYRVDTQGTDWKLECTLPLYRDTVAVYQIQNRTIEDCDAFAEEFKKIIPMEFEDISYYQEAAYYMDHGNGDGAHFLFVHYLDQGYEYTAIYDDEPVWANADRETVLKALEKYPLQIPDSAEFLAEGDGWYSVTIHQLVNESLLFDGILRVRYTQDGTIREIENNLLSYTYYRDVEVISPEEAYQRLQAGKFNDEGYFEHKNPRQVSVASCNLEYRVDTKGFYQPVYVFAVASPDGDYQSRILIPALQ